MKWISVKDKLPEEQKEVFVYAPDCDIIGQALVGVFFAKEKGFESSWTVYDFGVSKLDEKVTHWMPRPEPPK